MLTQFQVQNFKAFEDTTPIALKPLTLLSGINSAGKSSVIQALLLLKQTLESPPSLALSPGKGRLLEQSLGDNFNDFIFGCPDLDNAQLRYTLSFAFDRERDFDVYAAARAFYGGDGLRRVETDLDLTFQWGAFGHRGRPTVRVSDLNISLRLDNIQLVSLRIYPAETGGKYVVESKPEQCTELFQGAALSALEVDGLSNFLPDTLMISAQNAPSPIPSPISFIRLFRAIFVAMRRALSDDFCYLNSFRNPPQRIYGTGQTAGRVLEPNGSNFAEVLWQLQDEEVSFINSDATESRLPLPQMVDYVLREVLGLAQPLRVASIAQDILQVQLETLGSAPIPVTLSDVGLGYNQILPVVLQGLLTPPGGLVIFEQPEIHLHPDVQAKLVTFFVGLAKTGRRVLVETHSSHMIEYLCLEIAQDHANWLADNVQTLFVHAPDVEHAGARIEAIRITPYGEILNWPPRFLPDIAALDEKIIRAGFAKQQAERESQG